MWKLRNTNQKHIGNTNKILWSYADIAATPKLNDPYE